ncbi:hypothetical protein B0T49_16950 [Chromobacterium violaceum]|uniref:hypothetical protein n=1 Tax=Chromobacterium violaceum TaxID=536 RepID=UPI0009F0C091|nr:hypothetical protein [Chromobacterium violaceum]OQS47609.1 hypothetical protein B0T49_16950 [Chromobacterium violaceum]OQS49493.1 hypothetical protein B0T48_05510 [Chromobacterium violaceum]
MEVLYFLKLRTKFIQQYYNTASHPFFEIIRKIEFEEDPYISYDYDEAGPPFELEWNEAQTSLQMLGLFCVSMLSDSLKLYFQTWEKQLGFKKTKNEMEVFKSSGFLAGYRRYFSERLDAEWADGPANLDIIEQVILARNRAAHPDHITSISISHAQNDIKKYPNPLFVHESEKDLPITIWTPTLDVSKQALLDAIKQVETLTEWLEERMFAAKYKKIDIQQKN